MIPNPFDINKAVDYTDEDIYRFWVNISEPAGFNEMIKPNTLMPMIIVGSKGSGKTHIMKYYSYELQKIRLAAKKGKSLADSFKDETFIGIYVRCSGLNARVFEGKGVNDYSWEMMFAYYWELWVSERVLAALTDMKENSLLEGCDEEELVRGILSLFMKQEADCQTLKDLRFYLIKLQKELLYEIHNFLLLGKERPNVIIRLDGAALTFGIPDLLKAKVPFFKKRHILYLIDEYENFSEQQQQVIMTLLREKPTSCTIRIGTRPYGIRTKYTIGKIEENREGSEYEKLRLDEMLRESENYKIYLKAICEKRLTEAGLSLINPFSIEEYIDNKDIVELLESAREKKASQSVMINLKRNLGTYKNQKLSEKEIVEIIDCVTCKEDLVVERAGIKLLYMKMKGKSTTLVDDAKWIHDEQDNYLSKETRKDNAIAKHLSYYRKDIIDDIARRANIQIPYYGMNTLMDLSCGTPRTLLRLLKQAFSKQYFNTGKVPFEKGRHLLTESQQSGIESAGEWFFEENRIPNDSTGITEVVTRLGSYLQRLRFSDLPPQCSINIFSVQEETLSKEALQSLRTLERYSYLVPHKDRRKKNADSKVSTYKLNSILAPKFELALEARANVELTKDDAELIFNPQRKEEYEEFVKNKLKSYNYPFAVQRRVKAAPDKQRSLFDDEDGLQLF
ncbi:MAG: hypothetical protein IJJ72_05100 [Bacteroidales bacterium]|nr:hypothetical protein [Bacteroidales bacterium]